MAISGQGAAIRTLVRVLLIMFALVPAARLSADEVDDILQVRHNQQARMKRFSGEFTVETVQPKSFSNPKTTRIRYRLNLHRMPPGQSKNPRMPWAAEIEVLEPRRSSLRIEGEHVSYLDADGSWTPIVLLPEQEAQVSQIVEPYLETNPVEQRKKLSLRIVRHNNPILGPRTVTLQSIPQGQGKGLARIEEDLNEDGLPLATRVYDPAGKEAVRLKVTKHRKIKGISVVESSEAVSDTSLGPVTSRTTCTDVQIDFDTAP